MAEATINMHPMTMPNANPQNPQHMAWPPAHKNTTYIAIPTSSVMPPPQNIQNQAMPAHGSMAISSANTPSPTQSQPNSDQSTPSTPVTASPTTTTREY